jgi:serine protease Do
MVLDMDTSVGGATQISDALAELTREVSRSVVLVRGSMGSAGSGVVWADGRQVLTNHHVVPGQTAELTLPNGRHVQARVIRRAPSLDLAALDAGVDLETRAPVGDSDRLRVGDLVIAVGNPMGERNAPSLGVLASAPDGVLRLAMSLRPGNSGGALVNARGEVIGIPNMVTGRGVALAVSTRTVARFLRNDLEHEPETDSVRWM